MARYDSLVAMTTSAVANVIRSATATSDSRSLPAAELGLVELGQDVVLVEHHASPVEELVPRRHEEEQIGRVADLDHVEAALTPHSPREAAPHATGRRVLHEVAAARPPFDRHVVTIDVHALNGLDVGLAPAPFGEMTETSYPAR